MAGLYFSVVVVTVLALVVLEWRLADTGDAALRE